MLKAYTVAQIREAEDELAVGLAPGELMARAARGLAEALEFIPAGEVLLMLIGPGNNGGDALFAAVHLCDRGVRVDLCLLDEDKVHSEGLRAARSAGAKIVTEPERQTFCLDAVFGIGARPGLTGKADRWRRWVEESRPCVIAVDIPSGVDPDSSRHVENSIEADRTITLGTHKTSLLAGPAADHAGVAPAELVDIGLAAVLADSAPALEAIEPGDGRLITVDGRGVVDKYSRGVVGIAAGSEAYAGAAHLCVAGAQAGCAGMVRFVGSNGLSRRVVDRAPEVVAGRGRVQAWVVGPGGGEGAADQLSLALEDRVPLVVDASALAHLPPRFDIPALLTPHAGELAQMLHTRREVVESDPLRHVTEASRRWNATVLLKGKRTLVAQEGMPTRVNLSGSGWLATAGAGDVLAGLAGSLMAGGFSPYEAASLAAFLHGAAGVNANPGGPITAGDVADELPVILADFSAGRLDKTRDW